MKKIRSPFARVSKTTAGRRFGETPGDLPLSKSEGYTANDRTGMDEPGPSPVRRPTFEEISQRAYRIWQEAGSINDQHLDHWYAAERQLEEEFQNKGPGYARTSATSPAEGT